jgi:release factor glutamine methyltransferase
LDFYRRIATEAPLHLTERGMLAVEAGDGEAEAIAGLFREAGLTHVAIHNDLYGMARMVSGLAKE